MCIRDRKYGVQVTIHPLDLSDGENAKRLAKDTDGIDILVNNAGFSGPVVVNAVQEGSDDFGFDAEKNQYGSMYELGIIDPVKVTRSALENAASIAGMVLTTESLITELDPPKLPAPFDD